MPDRAHVRVPPPVDLREMLLALRDVLKLPPKHDWTEHAMADYTIADTDNEVSAKFCHPQPENSPDDVPEDVPYPSFSSFQERRGGGLIGEIGRAHV